MSHRHVQSHLCSLPPDHKQTILIVISKNSICLTRFSTCFCSAQLSRICSRYRSNLTCFPLKSDIFQNPKFSRMYVQCPQTHRIRCQIWRFPEMIQSQFCSSYFLSMPPDHKTNFISRSNNPIFLTRFQVLFSQPNYPESAPTTVQTFTFR